MRAFLILEVLCLVGTTVWAQQNVNLLPTTSTYPGYGYNLNPAGSSGYPNYGYQPIPTTGYPLVTVSSGSPPANSAQQPSNPQYPLGTAQVVPSSPGQQVPNYPLYPPNSGQQVPNYPTIQPNPGQQIPNYPPNQPNPGQQIPNYPPIQPNPGQQIPNYPQYPLNPGQQVPNYPQYPLIPGQQVPNYPQYPLIPGQQVPNYPQYPLIPGQQVPNYPQYPLNPGQQVPNNQPNSGTSSRIILPIRNSNGETVYIDITDLVNQLMNERPEKIKTIKQKFLSFIDPLGLINWLKGLGGKFENSLANCLNKISQICSKQEDYNDAKNQLIIKLNEAQNSKGMYVQPYQTRSYY